MQKFSIVNILNWFHVYEINFLIRCFFRLIFPCPLYIAEVKRELGLPMFDAPNGVEEPKRERQHLAEDMVIAIKDALKHFGII